MSTSEGHTLVWRAGGSGFEETDLVSAVDRGFQYGDGVFETMRAERGKVFFWREHMRRLEAGLELLGIEPFQFAEPARAAVETLLIRLKEEAVLTIKLVVTRGTGPPGPSTRGKFTPTVAATARPDESPRPGSMRVVTSKIVRNERSPLSRVKSLNYLEMILARREADAAGVEEALVLNTRGRLAEATAANLFAVADGLLVTPPVEEGCLPGIVRADVLRIARAAEPGLVAGVAGVAEEPMPPEVLAQATEAFLTNSRIGVAPLVEIDGRPVGDGRPGAVTAKLREGYREAELDSGRELDPCPSAR